MARPKLGTSETRRLDMVITADELAEIEGWQHANGVASRSAAIRLLCMIALRLDSYEFADAFTALTSPHESPWRAVPPCSGGE